MNATRTYKTGLLRNYFSLTYDQRRHETGDVYDEYINEYCATERGIISAYIERNPMPRILSDKLLNAEFTPQEIVDMFNELLEDNICESGEII